MCAGLWMVEGGRVLGGRQSDTVSIDWEGERGSMLKKCEVFERSRFSETATACPNK